MKKLLSLLSVLTISGTAVPTTIAASPYRKEEIKLEKNEIIQETNNEQNSPYDDLKTPSLEIYYYKDRKNKNIINEAKLHKWEYFDVMNINLGKVNPLDYKKIIFLGDISKNCGGSQTIWGTPHWNAWVYENKPGCENDKEHETYKVKGEDINTYLKRKDNLFHDIIYNMEKINSDSDISKVKNMTKSLQKFEDWSGLANIDIDQKFGLNFYRVWENNNDNYYLQIITYQDLWWKGSTSYLIGSIKLGNGIKLYND